MKKNIYILLIALSIFQSCKQVNKDTTEHFKSFILSSNDGLTEFEVSLSMDSLLVFDKQKKLKYEMKRVKSGSGIKYMDKNNVVIWLKGEEFTYEIKDSIIAIGRVKKLDLE